MDALAAQLLDAAALAALRADGSFDLVRSVAGLGRFRVNLYQQRGSVACAVRRVVPGIPTLEELELPASVAKLAEAQRGLVVLAGPSGSGTTTTAAAVVDAINRSRSVHIATIENPIEVLHADKEGIVSQREIGTDAPSMAEAVEHCLKQDPDVIFIGELPDADTDPCGARRRRDRQARDRRDAIDLVDRDDRPTDPGVPACRTAAGPGDAQPRTCTASCRSACSTGPTAPGGRRRRGLHRHRQVVGLRQRPRAHRRTSS